jgi:platelet-activating factor acetylhydrolase
LIILAQAKLDGTRWQVVPAYLSAVTCTGLNALGRVKGVCVPKILCRCVAVLGAAGASVSTLAGVFAPVFPMPKPTGPYRVGKTTRLWVDRNRRSWLLKTKRVFGAQALPEHRMMMVNIWYPAKAEDARDSKDKSAPPWPADEEAEARFAERAADASKTETDPTRTSGETNETNDDSSRKKQRSALNKQTEKTARHQARYEAKRAEARKSGKRRRAHWLDPTLATTLAESFYLPGWVVDYFRLVKMEAIEDAPVADPPRARTRREKYGDGADEEDGAEELETGSSGFPVVLFSHSFTGVKEQNSALLQEIASWGHIVVAVDHPHDAALVLYPDGSTADFRGYDMPKESEPRNWWRFRHEHARWRALDLAHALEKTVELSFDERSPLRGKIDLSRVACVGHSFGGAAAVMLAQMDPRITGVVALDPWMWPLGRETAMAGCPCPLLVLEAPEFMWNRDIFCVTNGETSSLMCAATAPRAAAEADADDERRASSDDARVSRNVTTNDVNDVNDVNDTPNDVNDNLSTTADADLAEDPSKPPPGFVGAEVDGRAGVGFYNEDGYYYTSNPPRSPTSHRRSAHFRPQHPRLGSSENLASLTSLTSLPTSLSSARSLGSVASLAGSDARDTEKLDELFEARAAPTAEEEAAAAVASYASGRPPRDPSIVASLAHASGSGGSGGSGDADDVSTKPEGLRRDDGSWSDILSAVNANEASSPGLKTVGSWGSLRRPFRRRSLSERRRDGSGLSVSSFGTHSGYGAEMQRDPSGVAFKAVLARTMHFDFTDIAMVAPLAATLFGVVGVGGREVHDVTSAATLRFLRMFNHPRDPDHSDPSAKELERLRAKLLSTAPVASVRAETAFGFSGGNAVVEPQPRSSTGEGRPSDTDRDKARDRALNALPRLKLGQMGHPAARHRGVRGGVAAESRASRRRFARDAAFRKSFDATHLPENWMDLETVPGSDEERGSSDTENGSVFSKNTFSKKATADSYGAQSRILASPTLDVSVETGRDGVRSDAKASSSEKKEADFVRSVAGDVNRAPARASHSEAKPRIVRWVKSPEWRLDPDRAFDASQRREMRWLLHECEKLGNLAIQPSDFVAMFPSFGAEAVKRAALVELTSRETHPKPKPLVWLAQMVVDGDVPRHTSEGGNHHGVPDEVLEAANEATNEGGVDV